MLNLLKMPYRSPTPLLKGEDGLDQGHCTLVHAFIVAKAKLMRGQQHGHNSDFHVLDKISFLQWKFFDEHYKVNN